MDSFKKQYLAKLITSTRLPSLEGFPEDFKKYYYEAVGNLRSQRRPELARYIYLYARDRLKAPFPPGESIVAKSKHYNTSYAQDVLKDPFPLAESFIAEDPESAYLYALNTLRRPFPPGEPAIAKNAFVRQMYLQSFPKRAMQVTLKMDRNQHFI